MRIVRLTLTLIAVSVPALALGKVTADPNAPGAVVQKPAEVDSTDARLSQKVTISESRKCASVILDDLTKLTGVTFKTGVNNNDWQVRDRKMSIFAKDVPLVQVMNSISHVMKFKWDRKGDNGKWTYRLYMDRRTLLDADSQKLREDERLRDKATQKRKKALDSYVNIDKASAADLAIMKSKDPMLYVLATTGIAGSMGQMFREVPALSDAMAAGQPITLSGADMPQGGRDGLKRMVSSIFTFAKQAMPNEPNIPDASKIDVASMTLEVNKSGQNDGDPWGKQIMLANLNIKFDSKNIMQMPIMDPESAIGHVVGDALLKVKEGQLDLKDLSTYVDKEIQNAVATDIERLTKDFGEPVIQHPDDPALKAKIKMTPEGPKLADVQKALANASSYAVVSDSFGRNTGAYEFVTSENELGVVLDKVVKTAMYNWDKRATVIEFRDREWFRKRTAQIPEATIENWRQALKNTGTLDLPDLAEIARLDQEQYNMNVKDDDFLSTQSIDGVIMLQRDVLRLYGTLTESQRAAMVSDAGLDLRDLTAEQLTAATKVIDTRNPKYQQKQGEQVTLKMTRTQDGKQFHYTFSAEGGKNTTPAKCEFTTPKYQEPKIPPDHTKK